MSNIDSVLIKDILLKELIFACICHKCQFHINLFSTNQRWKYCVGVLLHVLLFYSIFYIRGFKTPVFAFIFIATTPIFIIAVECCVLHLRCNPGYLHTIKTSLVNWLRWTSITATQADFFSRPDCPNWSQSGWLNLLLPLNV